MAKNLQNSITSACPLFYHQWHLCTLDGLSHAHTALTPKVVQFGVGRHGVTRHPLTSKNKNVTVHMKVLSFTHAFNGVDTESTRCFYHLSINMINLCISMLQSFQPFLHCMCRLCHRVPGQSRRKPQISPGTCHRESRDPRHQKEQHSAHVFSCYLSSLRVPC